MGGLEKFTGGISFGVSMATQTLSRNVGFARKLISGFVSSISKQLFSLKGLLVGLGAALASGKFANAIKAQFQAVDKLGDTASALGVTSAALAGLGHAAEQSGSSPEKVASGLAKMVKSTSDAAQGLGTASLAFKQLGLNAGELNKLSPDQQFLQIADAISKVSNEQEQLAITQRIFGRGSSELVNVLRLGSDGLSKMQEEAAALGLAIDEKSVRGIQRAVDAFQRFKGAISGIFRSIAVEISPVVEGLSDKLTSFLAAGERGKSVGKAIGGFIIEAVKKIADVAQQAFAALLRFAAMGLEVFAKFSTSILGQEMGLSAPTQDDFTRIGKLRNSAAFLEHERNLPSTMIDKSIASIRSETAAEVAPKLPSGMSGEEVGGLAKSLGAAIGPAVQRGLSSLGSDAGRLSRSLGISDALSGTKLFGKQLGSQLMGDGPKRQPIKAATFDAQESGSLAAYQQRVRGMQQMTKTPEKQLKEAEKANGYLETIANGFKGFAAEGPV